MEKNKRLERVIDELTLFSDELMSRVFDGNIEATEYLLRTVLGRNDIKVKSVKGEYRMASPLTGGRNITLDIHAEEAGGKEFDVEVQNKTGGAHVRRARFHSSMLDVRMLKEGQQFRKLKDSYVIFMYRHDKFRRGLPIYHIERNVVEIGEQFGDGSHIIYVNGRYRGDDAVGRLVHDFNCRKAGEMYSRSLAAGVKHFKETKEGRAEMSDVVEKYAEEIAREREKRSNLKSVKNLMETMKWSVDQALDALKIDEKKERESIIKAVRG